MSHKTRIKHCPKGLLFYPFFIGAYPGLRKALLFTHTLLLSVKIDTKNTLRVRVLCTSLVLEVITFSARLVQTSQELEVM
jgi:hypothetical protein